MSRTGTAARRNVLAERQGEHRDDFERHRVPHAVGIECLPQRSRRWKQRMRNRSMHRSDRWWPTGPGPSARRDLLRMGRPLGRCSRRAIKGDVDKGGCRPHALAPPQRAGASEICKQPVLSARGVQLRALEPEVVNHPGRGPRASRLKPEHRGRAGVTHRHVRPQRRTRKRAMRQRQKLLAHSVVRRRHRGWRHRQLCLVLQKRPQMHCMVARRGRGREHAARSGMAETFPKMTPQGSYAAENRCVRH